MNRRGITLVELVAVLSVIVVMIVSAGYSYQGWARNYEIEIATKELYADLMRARVLAVAKCRKHFFTTNGTVYTIFEDKDEDGVPEAGEELPTFPKRVKHVLNSNVASPLSFNDRGLLQVPRTLRFELVSEEDPDYDCVKISRTRIIVGKYNGTDCRID